MNTALCQSVEVLVAAWVPVSTANVAGFGPSVFLAASKP